VQVGDVAEPDQRLRVGADGVEVEPVDKALCAGPALGRDDRADLGIGVGGIEVGESVLVTSGQVTAPVQDMLTDLDIQTQPRRICV
jgi:hypothetical protein